MSFTEESEKEGEYLKCYYKAGANNKQLGISIPIKVVRRLNLKPGTILEVWFKVHNRDEEREWRFKNELCKRSDFVFTADKNEGRDRKDRQKVKRDLGDAPQVLE